MNKSLILLLLVLSFVSCDKLEEAVVEPHGELQGRVLTKGVSDQLVVGYFPSWSESYPTAAGTTLRNMPEEVTHVFLSFIKPNMRYTKGSFDIKGVGIEVPYDGPTLKETVDILKAKGTKVILSIGGETYWGTEEAYDINHQQIADFVRDFGFNGIDWDYEPNGGFATIGEPRNVERFISMIRESRKLLPREEGFLIACAPAGCGALGRSYPYAVNDDAQSPYAYAKRAEVTGNDLSKEYDATSAEGYTISLYGFASTGHMIPVFKSVGKDLDFVAFQGYNVGSASQREIMYDSYAYYANIYGFRVAFGMHVPNEPWGPYYTYSEQKVREYAQYVAEGGKHNRAGKGDGVMFWQLLQKSALNGALNGVEYSKIAYRILENSAPTTTPKVVISSPVSNSMIRENQTITFSVNAKKSVKVEFYVDNKLVATGSQEPFETKVKGLSLGDHTFKTIGYGTSGERVEAVCTVKIISENSVEDVPAWKSNTTYATSATLVLHNNKVWSNKWWTQGDEPGKSDVWGFVRNADGSGGGNTDGDGGSTDGDDGNTDGDGGSTDGGGGSTDGGGDKGDGSQYNASLTYPNPGTIVTYNGKKYKSKWFANIGDTPGSLNGPWELILENGEGTTPDKALVYDIKSAYPTPGTYVIYEKKIYTNKWYVAVGEYPGKDQWGAWVLAN